jgi:Zn-dependent peptidase ImmA (M78 family)
MAIRRRKIQSLCQELLSTHGITAPPVPVKQLAHACGARLALDRLEGDLSGFVYRDGDQTVIGVNTRHAPTRQRFTIAHELGHLLLHQPGEIHLDRNFSVRLRDDTSSQGTKPEEIEANLFAAEILMPSAFLERDLRNVPIDLVDEEVVSMLAKKYGVSTQALVIRLTSLGYLSPMALE